MTVDHKFADTLNGLLSRIFREGASSLHSPKAAEALRKSTDELAKDFDNKIKTTATELVKQLQDRVIKGFDLLEKDNEELKKRVDVLEQLVNDILRHNAGTILTSHK